MTKKIAKYKQRERTNFYLRRMKDNKKNGLPSWMRIVQRNLLSDEKFPCALLRSWYNNAAQELFFFSCGERLLALRKKALHLRSLFTHRFIWRSNFLVPEKPRLICFEWTRASIYTLLHCSQSNAKARGSHAELCASHMDIRSLITRRMRVLAHDSAPAWRRTQALSCKGL